MRLKSVNHYAVQPSHCAEFCFLDCLSLVGKRPLEYSEVNNLLKGRHP